MINNKNSKNTFNIISPVDDKIIATYEYAQNSTITKTLSNAKKAQLKWKNISLTDRKYLVSKAIDNLVSMKDKIAHTITLQMGRPISQSPSEVLTLTQRAKYMIDIAEESLCDIKPNPEDGFIRFLRKEPLGLILVLVPWNYPCLTAINSIIPALVAGNSVILKSSDQTAGISEIFYNAFKMAGIPEYVFSTLHLDIPTIAKVIAMPDIDFVAFTGSVAGGLAVQKAASNKFIGVGLELGGKDPAYVLDDADLDFTVENLVDGAFFNSGQTCCSIERIYVKEAIFDIFIDKFLSLSLQYKLGNPLDKETNLGPMVRSSAKESVQNYINEALAKGAKALIPSDKFKDVLNLGKAYMAPQILVNVHHSMPFMMEEVFGPAVGIMPVKNDEEAIELMNDSPYGLTASIWSTDMDRAIYLGERIETGTVFLNRCDYLDPSLAWTGVKNTGRGISLSKLGYDQLTRVKSYHLRHI